MSWVIDMIDQRCNGRTKPRSLSQPIKSPDYPNISAAPSPQGGAASERRNSLDFFGWTLVPTFYICNQVVARARTPQAQINARKHEFVRIYILHIRDRGLDCENPRAFDPRRRETACNLAWTGFFFFHAEHRYKIAFEGSIDSNRTTNRSHPSRRRLHRGYIYRYRNHFER